MKNYLIQNAQAGIKLDLVYQQEFTITSENSQCLHEAKILKDELEMLRFTVVLTYQTYTSTVTLRICRNGSTSLNADDLSKIRNLLDEHGFKNNTQAEQSEQIDVSSSASKSEPVVLNVVRFNRSQFFRNPFITPKQGLTVELVTVMLSVIHWMNEMIEDDRENAVNYFLVASEIIDKLGTPEMRIPKLPATKKQRFSNASREFKDWMLGRKIGAKENGDYFDLELVTDHTKALLCFFIFHNCNQYIRNYDELCEFAQYLNNNSSFIYDFEKTEFKIKIPPCSRDEFDDSQNVEEPLQNSERYTRQTLCKPYLRWSIE